MKRLQVPQKLVYEIFYVHEIVTVDLSKIFFLKNAKKRCKPNNRDLNRDWIIQNFSPAITHPICVIGSVDLK